MAIEQRLAWSAMMITLLFFAPAMAQSSSGDLQGSDQGAQVAAIIKEHGSRMDAFYESYQAAKDDAARQEFYESSYPKLKPYVDRLAAVVEQTPADPAARTAILWILRNADMQTQRAEWLDVLLVHHMDSDEIGDACNTLARDPSLASSNFLSRVINENAARETVGKATFALSGVLGTRISMKGRLARSYEANRSDILAGYGAELLELCETTSVEEFTTQRKQLLVTVREEYGDVPRRNSTLGLAAQGELFELEHLQVGRVAPDIDGFDLNGLYFKLSDYRGKAIFLDFWGDW